MKTTIVKCLKKLKNYIFILVIICILGNDLYYYGMHANATEGDSASITEDSVEDAGSFFAEEGIKEGAENPDITVYNGKVGASDAGMQDAGVNPGAVENAEIKNDKIGNEGIDNTETKDAGAVSNNSLPGTVSENQVDTAIGKENTVSENTVSENTVSENTVSENTVSGNTVSENTVSQNKVEDELHYTQAFSYTKDVALSGSHVTLTMNAAAGVLPDGASARIRPIYDTSAIAEAAEAGLAENESVKKVMAVDITLYCDVQGEETIVSEDMIHEVDGKNVTVAFTRLPVLSGESAEVVHVDGEQVEPVEEQKTSGKTAVFDAPHFSTYAIVITGMSNIENETEISVTPPADHADVTLDIGDRKELFFFMQENYGIKMWAVDKNSLRVENTTGMPAAVEFTVGTEAYKYCDSAFHVLNAGTAKISFRYQIWTIEEDNDQEIDVDENHKNTWYTMTLTLNITGVAVEGAITCKTLEPVQLTATVLGVQETEENKGVTWSIKSGNGTVDQTGKVTLVPQITGRQEIVVVRAVSNAEPKLYKDYTITFDTSSIFTFHNYAESTGVRLYYVSGDSNLHLLRAGETIAFYVPTNTTRNITFYAAAQPGYQIFVDVKSQGEGYQAGKFDEIGANPTGVMGTAKYTYGCTKTFQYNSWGNGTGKQDQVHRGFVLTSAKSNIKLVYGPGNTDTAHPVSNLPSDNKVYSIDGEPIEVSSTIPTKTGYLFQGWQVETRDKTSSIILMGGDTRSVESMLDYVTYALLSNGKIDDANGTITLTAVWAEKPEVKYRTIKYQTALLGDLQVGEVTNRQEVVVSGAQPTGTVAKPLNGYKVVNWKLISRVEDTASTTPTETTGARETTTTTTAPTVGSIVGTDPQYIPAATSFTNNMTETYEVTFAKDDTKKKNIQVDYFIDGEYHDSKTVEVWVNDTTVPFGTIKDAQATEEKLSLVQVITYEKEDSKGVSVYYDGGKTITVDDTAVVPLSKNIGHDIQIHYTRNHTLRFHGNGNTNNVPDIYHTPYSYAYGTNVTIPAVINTYYTKDDYTFMGWSEDPEAIEATVRYYGENREVTFDMVDHDMNLYAVWRGTNCTYKVHYVDAEHVEKSGVHKQLLPDKVVENQAYNSIVEELAPFIPGYEPDIEGRQFRMKPENLDDVIEITFYYTLRTDLTYHVYYYQNGTLVVADVSSAIYKLDDEITSITRRDFDGWNYVGTTGLPLVMSGIASKDVIRVYFERTESSGGGGSTTTPVTPVTPVTPEKIPEVEEVPVIPFPEVPATDPDTDNNEENAGRTNGNTNDRNNGNRGSHTQGTTITPVTPTDNTAIPEIPQDTLQIPDAGTVAIPDDTAPNLQTGMVPDGSSPGSILQAVLPKSLLDLIGIGDGESPLAAMINGCDIHWYIIMLTILYSCYAVIRIFCRDRKYRKLRKKINHKDEEQQS